jgi:putative endonuclease
MAKGYRILALRLRTPQGEIDLLARRGQTLAVVEVKRRGNLQAARDAVTPDQRRRLIAAAGGLARRRKSLAGLEVRLDLFVLAPGARPRHIAGAWGHE